MEDCSLFRKNHGQLANKTIASKKHKDEYDESKKNESNQNLSRKKLTSYQISNIYQNLSLKINIVNECESKIIQETESYIERIQDQCFQAIKKLEVKKQSYMRIIKSIASMISAETMGEIQSTLETHAASYVPSLDYIGAQCFFRHNFLKEFKSMSEIDDPTRFLADYYNLFITTHENLIRSLHTTSDNKYLISVSRHSAIEIWNLQEKIQVRSLPYSSTRNINTLTVSSDGKYIAFLQNSNCVCMWNHQEKKLEESPVPGLCKQTCATISSDLRYLVSGTSDSKILVWNIQENRLKSVFQSDIASVSAVKITTDNKFIVSTDGIKESSEDFGPYAVRIWNLQAKIQEATMFGHNEEISELAVSSDGKYIATASEDSTVRIWSFLQQVQIDVIYEVSVRAIEITSDSRYIVYSSVGCILLYNLIDKVQEYAFTCDNGHCLSRTASDQAEGSSEKSDQRRESYLSEIKEKELSEKGSDSRSDASEEEYMNKMNNEYDSAEDKEYIERSPSYSSESLAKNKESINRSCDASSDSIVHRRVSSKRKDDETSIEIESYITTMTTTCDSKYIVCGYGNGMVRIWNLWERKEEFTLQGHKTPPKIVIWTKDKRYIVTCSTENLIRIWNLDMKKQQAVLKKTYAVSSMAVTVNIKYIVLSSYYDDSLDTMGVYQFSKIIN